MAIWEKSRQAARTTRAKVLRRDGAQHAGTAAKPSTGLDLEKWTITCSLGNKMITSPHRRQVVDTQQNSENSASASPFPKAA